MARRPVDTAIFKISWSGDSVKYLEALCKVGIYGKSPPEVIRRLAEEGMERVVFKDKVLQTAGISVATPGTRRRRSAAADGSKS